MRRYAIKQINSGRYAIQRRDGGYSDTYELSESTLFESHQAAHIEAEVMRDWLNARNITQPQDFYYPGGRWNSWTGGLNVTIGVDVEITYTEVTDEREPS